MMANGGIYYIPLTVGDVQSRTSWSCVRTEIGMFDLKKQFFYLVFLDLSEETYLVDTERSSAVGQIADFLPW